MNEEIQNEFANLFIEFYQEIPFSEKKNNHDRYYFDNLYFTYGDAISLYSMIRIFQPKRIIEIGSGFSSAEMLDINDRFFAYRMRLTFIEPYPERLLMLLRDQDGEIVTIKEKRVQQVPKDIFSELSANDILFIDSSHVAKTASDVLYILFDILPCLSAGVLVHFHDILWPFEYPNIWINEGRAWNEAYFVRAFLQYNTTFEILFFNSFMEVHHSKFLLDRLPLMLKVPSIKTTLGNTSLWLRKLK